MVALNAWQELEEQEIYDLVVRMRELVDEHLHTGEGAARLRAEVERRQGAAQAALEKVDAEVSRSLCMDIRSLYFTWWCCECTQLAKYQQVLLDVRKQQLDMIERARRFRAGWEFIEHKYGGMIRMLFDHLFKKTVVPWLLSQFQVGA